MKEVIILEYKTDLTLSDLPPDKRMSNTSLSAVIGVRQRPESNMAAAVEEVETFGKDEEEKEREEIEIDLANCAEDFARYLHVDPGSEVNINRKSCNAYCHRLLQLFPSRPTHTFLICV